MKNGLFRISTPITITSGELITYASGLETALQQPTTTVFTRQSEGNCLILSGMTRAQVTQALSGLPMAHGNKNPMISAWQIQSTNAREFFKHVVQGIKPITVQLFATRGEYFQQQLLNLITDLNLRQVKPTVQDTMMELLASDLGLKTTIQPHDTMNLLLTQFGAQTLRNGGNILVKITHESGKNEFQISIVKDENEIRDEFGRINYHTFVWANQNALFKKMSSCQTK